MRKGLKIIAVFLLAGGLSPAIAATPVQRCLRILESEWNKRWEKVSRIAKDPLQFREAIEKRALRAKTKGQKSFSYAEQAPVVRQALEHISKDLVKFRGTAFEGQLLELSARGKTLMNTGVQYHDAVTFFFDWTDLVDRLIRVGTLEKISVWLPQAMADRAQWLERAQILIKQGHDNDPEFSKRAHQFTTEILLLALRRGNEVKASSEIQFLIDAGHALQRGDDHGLKPVEWVERTQVALESLGIAMPFGVSEYLTSFHSGYGKRRLKELLDEAPHRLMVFMFDHASVRHINRLRPSGVLVVGLARESQYLDNFWLSPGEAAYHDVGHSWLMSQQDKRFGLKNESQVARMRQAQYQRLERAIDELQVTDPGLLSVVDYYLFEVGHERGYPFDIAINANEINTEMWVETILKKLSTRFWGRNPVTPEQFSRLNEARLWLLGQFKISLEEAVLEQFSKAPVQTTATYIVTPLQRSYRGQLQGFEISQAGKILAKVWVPEIKEQRLVGLFDFSVSQVPTAEPTAWTEEMAFSGWNALLEQKQAWPLVIDLSGVGRASDGSAIILPTTKPTSAKPPLTSYDLFKARQLLYMSQKKMDVVFSFSDPAVEISGQIVGIEGQPGEKVAVFSDGRKVPLHLMSLKASDTPSQPSPRTTPRY